MFKKINAIAVILFTVTGCGPVLREVRHPGGYPGYLLDQKTFDASRSKQLQLYRAALIMAMAARMGTATIRDGKDADAFVDYLGAASDEINYAAANIYPVNGQPPCAVHPYLSRADVPKVATPVPNLPCLGGYFSLFESDVPMMEARITRLMLAALPEDRARSFLQDVGKGNIFSAAWNAIGAASEATGGLHRASGVYRTGLELLAANMDRCREKSASDTERSKSIGEPDTPPDRAIFEQDKSTVWDASQCLGLSHDKFFASPDEAVGGNIGASVTLNSLQAIMRVARTACMRLQINTEMDRIDDIAERYNIRTSQCKIVNFSPRLRPGTNFPPPPLIP
jgi:hypothetical protein